ncbi:MAG: nicotinamide mononucleotide transporter [Oscillospiraceae bacterium]|nr:nicotinamide mononucleotide transporter [Oscillospiraceae bacterium]
MEAIKKLVKYLTLFQWAELLAVTGFTVYFALTDTETPPIYNIIGSAAAICGVLCVILCAAGKKSQYYWGFANIILYIIISFVNKFYGEVMLNALYYFPSQFVGIYLWKKNYSEDIGQVKGRRMKPVYALLTLAGTAAGIILYRSLLSFMGGSSPWLDSASTVISITANALMVMRYREQWLLWIIVDTVTVIMWAGKGDPIMTTMWAVYLLNAVYGYVNWSRMSRTENA